MKKLMLSTVFAIYTSVVYADICETRDRQDEIEALALNMYHEARGDGSDAMQMVGEVTLNRIRSVAYPDTVCEVVFQKSQFSWTVHSDAKITDEQEWEEALDIAEKLLDGNIDYFDNGATHFINPNAVKRMPSWTNKFVKVGKIGKHIFYVDKSKKNNMLGLNGKPKFMRSGI